MRVGAVEPERAVWQHGALVSKLRVLGAKVGRRARCSTAALERFFDVPFTPLELCDPNFIAVRDYSWVASL
jgi:hypothetical protein